MLVSAAGFELEASSRRERAFLASGSLLPKSRASAASRGTPMLVSAAGFEPVTHALKGVAARKINDLD